MSGMASSPARRAARAGNWQLAVSMVIDDLAITEIIEPRGSPSLADEFGGMPPQAAESGPKHSRTLSSPPSHWPLADTNSASPR
jgi:hypothetical protein